MDKALDEIYIRYNQAEDTPDITMVVEDINFLLNLLGYKRENN